MNRTPKLLIAGYCLSFLISLPLQAQTIIQHTIFEDITYGIPPEWVFKTPNDDYILSIPKDECNTEGLLYNGELIPAFHTSIDEQSYLQDLFICKVQSDFTFQQHFVIDNAELGRDLFSNESYVLYSMSINETTANQDSFPLLLNGVVEIPREGNRGKGVLIVMDSNLEFQKYFFPSTGDIGQVAVDGNMAYLELRIPSREPYIIVNGTDTIHNQHEFNDPDDFGRQTVVLCKYNLLTNLVEWTLRIGNVGYEELKEMQIDDNHNLVILGETSSVYFSFHGTDTVLNYADHSPFVAKYSSNGEFLAGFINPNDENASAITFLMDNSNDIYITGYYVGDNFVIEDTMLIRPGLGRPNNTQAILYKLNSNVEFEWIMQAAGDFETTGFFDLAEMNPEELIISGTFYNGELTLNGQSYYDEPVGEKRFGYLLKVNKGLGTIDEHVMTYGDYVRGFHDVEVDSDGNVDLFMRFRGRDTIFDTVFETSLEVRNGYLLKLKLSPVLNDEPRPDALEFSIAPNPVSGDGFSIINHSHALNMSYAILDIMGRVLEKNNISPDNTSIISVDNWATGPYWIRIYSDDHFQTNLFIIQ